MSRLIVIGVLCAIPCLSCGSSKEQPAEVRVHRNVVNVVSPSAARELRTALQRGGTPRLSSQAFYEVFDDDYDFVYLLTDEVTSESATDSESTPGVNGRIFPIHRPSIPGTGIDEETNLEGFEEQPRLKALIAAKGGMSFGFPVLGPWAHEFAHYWANYLDSDLGLTSDFGHFTSAVPGPLGGAELVCVEPAGARIPDCAQGSGGRYRLTPDEPDDLQELPFSELELYLMGLLTGSEVEQRFFEPVDVQVVPLSSGSGPPELDVAGFREVIAFEDIVRRHGLRATVPEEERHFQVAFVIVTDQPADEALLEATADAVESFGGLREPDLFLPRAFHELTGRLATLSVELSQPRSEK